MELSSDRQADEMSRLTSISLPRVEQVTGLIVTAAMKVHSSSGCPARECLGSLPGSRAKKRRDASRSTGWPSDRLRWRDNWARLPQRPPRSRPSGCLNWNASNVSTR